MTRQPTGTMSRCSLALAVAGLLLLHAAPSSAQAPAAGPTVEPARAAIPARFPVHLALRVGVAAPEADYQMSCGHSHLVAGAQARTRGKWFASLAADAYMPGMGSDVGCVGGGWGDGTMTELSGGLDLGSAVRIGAGVGRSSEWGAVAFDGTLAGGLIRGRPGYDGRGDDAARLLPWAGAVATGRLFGVIEIAWEQGWTRLPYREEIYLAQQGHYPPPGATPIAEREVVRWGRLGTLSVGVRW